MLFLSPQLRSLVKDSLIRFVKTKRVSFVRSKCREAPRPCSREVIGLTCDHDLCRDTLTVADVHDRDALSNLSVFSDPQVEINLRVHRAVAEGHHDVAVAKPGAPPGPLLRGPGAPPLP